MSTTKLSHFTTHQHLLKDALADPSFKREYDKLEPEYQLTAALIKARLASNLTQDELAKKAGVNQATIARIEGGANNPTVHTLTRVATALGKKITLV